MPKLNIAEFGIACYSYRIPQHHFVVGTGTPGRATRTGRRMGWIEKKFEEQRQAEEQRRKKEAEAEARRRLQEERILNVWGRLVHTIEQDILAFNQHPDAPGKLLATTFDNTFEIHWQDNYGPLLLIELNLDQQILKYSTPVQQPEKWRAHLGEIKFSPDFELLVPNGSGTTKKASVQDASRFLLEPVLF